MRIDILTVVPELLVSPLGESILKRAQNKGLVEIVVHNIRDYTTDRHRQVDDYPFGGEAGMVMMAEPVARAIDSLRAERHYDEIIYTSPDGVRHDQHEANRLSMMGNIIILCGHYKGLDQRLRDTYITREISIGDYVLTGGELAAAVIADSIVRLLPGAIGDEESALSDSFQDDLLAPPVYTRPAEWRGLRVPDVLLSGNPALIRDWQHEQAMERTERLRPDLLKYEPTPSREQSNSFELPRREGGTSNEVR
ncbi:MAG: tRNA (guanosine(37)-N1)-methyltransferase TrmD [Alistipes sp.]|nr:tRNA (guanosine(37)-N1)-methyltransferase TrmD [Alistipes sp.]